MFAVRGVFALLWWRVWVCVCVGGERRGGEEGGRFLPHLGFEPAERCRHLLLFPAEVQHMATFTARLIGWMHGCGVVDAHALSSQCLLGGSQLLPQQLGLNCEAEADMAANGTSYTLSTMFLPQDLMPSVLQQLRAPPTCPPGSTSQRHGQRYSGLERGRGRGPCCRDHSAALQGGGGAAADNRSRGTFGPGNKRSVVGN